MTGTAGTGGTTRIIIVDDQALFREGLRTLLSTRPDMDVVGEAGDGDEAVALVESLQPAVVLMDLRMPKADGIQATARIRERWPEIPVLVLTTFDDDANLFGALRAGAAGYLLKDVSSETLVSAIHAATRGESFLQSTVTGRVVAAFARLMEAGGPRAEALVLPLSRSRTMGVPDLTRASASPSTTPAPTSWPPARPPPTASAATG